MGQGSQGNVRENEQFSKKSGKIEILCSHKKFFLLLYVHTCMCVLVCMFACAIVLIFFQSVVAFLAYKFNVI